MKLIFCPECHDVRKIHGLRYDSCECQECVRKYATYCNCGEAWGYYKRDKLNASVGGEAIPLGFANASLSEAIGNRPVSGAGSRFEAFVIPIVCDTIVEGW